jgi:hypothetical protein
MKTSEWNGMEIPGRRDDVMRSVGVKRRVGEKQRV